MSTDQPFLARWSLRKQASRAAVEVPTPADDPAIAAPLPADPRDPAPHGACPDPASPNAPDAGPPDAETPPDHLPALDDLGAESDYTGFLDRKVPKALRQAALRKAWSSDPVIAAYRPLADYDWDFNAPGYAALRPTDDPSKFITALFQHLKKEPEPIDGADEPADAFPAGNASPLPDDPSPDDPAPDVPPTPDDDPPRTA